MTPLQIWQARIAGTTRGYTLNEQHQMAVMAVDVDKSGGNTNVWHLGSIVREGRCPCQQCRYSAEQMG